MKWCVEFATRKTEKSASKLPDEVRSALTFLIQNLTKNGPIQPEWSHFGKLKKQKGQPQQEERFHCHLKRGRPTYVAVWRCNKKTILVEISYVGTHENAPY